MKLHTVKILEHKGMKKCSDYNVETSDILLCYKSNAFDTCKSSLDRTALYIYLEWEVV
jgi:hypothetical protein